MTMRDQRTFETSALTTALSDQIESLLKQRTVLAQGLELIHARVFCGPLSQHLRPTKLVEGTLHIESRDPQWARAVDHMQHELIREIRRFAPEVQDLAFEAAPADAPVLDDPGNPRPRSYVESPPSGDLDEAIQRLLNAKRG